ncbi:hypothetical protein TorRG33x02_322310 [Trema orientale]|uniref:Uncharacterized protein n=1 Tax=Trema orientale TaxID=63057 RepID=A0A2P5BG35_TREOI|nr:hypothetical protein TorRG33x02_322310 [Trema orientale]
MSTFVGRSPQVESRTSPHWSSRYQDSKESKALAEKLKTLCLEEKLSAALIDGQGS